VLAPSNFQNRLLTRFGERVLVFAPVLGSVVGSVFGTRSRYADAPPRRLRRSHNVVVTTAEEPHVLIAGAGPIGLTAAIELARRGVTVRIVDPLLEPPLYAKAVGVQPRTLEVF
jgi:FAD binding domain-containing protein